MLQLISIQVISTNHTPFTIMEGHHRHGRYWKLGGGALSVVVLLMAAQFGGMHTFIGTYSVDDAAILIIKEQRHHAANEPLVDFNMVPLLSRVWNPTGNNYSWCVAPRAGKNGVNGLVYVKVPKTASSTSAGATLQISRNIGRTMLGQGKSCSESYKHGEMFRNRKPPYLLWTTLRHPAKRAISNFFYREVSRFGQKPSSENMLKLLHRSKNFQLKYISTEKIPSNATHLLYDVAQDPVELIRRNVFEHYHFIAITERMTESLVVMKMLWGLSDKDIIVMSTKRSGGYDTFGAKCVKIQPSFTTPEVDDYIRTNFTNDNHDYLLYAAANESLDLTIAALGKLRFAEELERHLGLQKIAEDTCLDKTYFPCTSTGELQIQVAARNCLFHDHGCGYPCLDELFKNHSVY
jgi:hypothetical protein